MTDALKTILANTHPLTHPRGKQLPLFVWALQHPGTDSSTQISDILCQLDSRRIPLISAWKQNDIQSSLESGIQVGRLQQEAGLLISVNVNALLHRFFNGDPDTAHLDDHDNPFFDFSFDPNVSIGCPFALEHRIPEIRDRVSHFADAYQRAGIQVDLAFADWEIDGPIEWNGAWETSKKCKRCKAHMPDIDDFECFQRTIREIRPKLQREAYADVLRDRFRDVCVGNYAVYPHGGERFWYDYFEPIPIEGPYRLNQEARVRPWAHEFADTHYTLSMSVIYTWYRTFDWYDFENPDYRWFYNMLQVATNAGQHKGETPLISFVHWHTTAPPDHPDPDVQQMSEEAYQDLLWHTLLRGHDGLALWCLKPELAKEIRLLHEVYAESLEHSEILAHGRPLTFDIPENPATIVSAVRRENQILARNTPFGAQHSSKLEVGGRSLELRPGATHLIRI